MFEIINVYCFLAGDWEGKKRIQKDRTAVQHLSETLAENLDPFSPDLDPEKLNCFTNGVALKADIAEDLLGMYGTGEKWMKEFIAECKENPRRFEETIKRRQIKNFTADGMKVIAKGKELKMI